MTQICIVVFQPGIFPYRVKNKKNYRRISISANKDEVHIIWIFSILAKRLRASTFWHRRAAETRPSLDIRTVSTANIHSKALLKNATRSLIGKRHCHSILSQTRRHYVTSHFIGRQVVLYSWRAVYMHLTATRRMCNRLYFQNGVNHIQNFHASP